MQQSDLNFSQQAQLFDPKIVQSVHVIGAGSVGSHVVNQLVRIGVTDITVWDDDSINSHNIGPSLYGIRNVGYFKVDTLRAIIARDTGVEIKVAQQRYTGQKLRGVVVACVDNMETRQIIWGAVKQNIFATLLLDTRTAEYFTQVFAVRPSKPEDIEEYEPYLAYSSSEAVRQSCGRHSIGFIAIRAAITAVEALSGFWQSGRTEFVRMEQLGSNVYIHPNQEKKYG